MARRWVVISFLGLSLILLVAWFALGHSLLASAAAGQTTRVSVSSAGMEGNNESWSPVVSDDGRYIAFESNASNLVPDDTNGTQDVFVYDRQTGITTRVSVSSGGVEGNLASRSPAISADGRYVAFLSQASNLVPGDMNGALDVFVHDRQTTETVRVSVSSSGTEGNGWSNSPAISADGRFVAFTSHASNLVLSDTNGAQDTFVRDRESGTTTRVSVSSGGVEGNNLSYSAVISADGRYVAFNSAANNLVPGDNNAEDDSFLHDRQNGTTIRVSVSSNEAEANGDSFVTDMSADGRYLAFFSDANNLVPSDTNGARDVFVRDHQTGTTARVSVSSAGAEASSWSDSPAISADGRFVAFTSYANNLVPGDTNGTFDVFVHERETGTTTRVSISSGMAQGNNLSSSPTISGDGSQVAFHSDANNLVPDDMNGVRDVFVHEREIKITPTATATSSPTASPTPSKTSTPTSTNTPVPTTTATVTATGLPTSTATSPPSATPTPTWTPTNTNTPAPTSTATATATGQPTATATNPPPATATATNTPVPPPTTATVPAPTATATATMPPANGGATTRVSVSSSGEQGNNNSSISDISADGRYVAFRSGATNLVPNDTNRNTDIFVHDRQTNQTTRVSVSSDGTQGSSVEDDNYFAAPSISADGRFVAFASQASNLVVGDTNGDYDVFVHDRQTGQTERVSVSSGGAQGSGYDPAISADGRYVAFSSYSINLVPGDTYSWSDIFVHDRQTGQTTRVSISSGGAQGNGESYDPAISADGRYVTFWSDASNLVPGDAHGTSDIFVRDRQTGQTTRVSVSSDGTQGNGGSLYPAISADGRYVTFTSGASNLVPGDTNGTWDVFVHDRQTHQTTRVSVNSSGAQGNGGSHYPAISADGRYVAFASPATNLVPNDTNHKKDIFVHDRQASLTTRVSVSTGGAQVNWQAEHPALSADGRYVAFTSDADNLVPGDTNGRSDIFVHDRLAGTGFQRGVDGFPFRNRGASYTEAIDDFGGEEMIELFGEDEVCNMIEGQCEFTFSARLWYQFYVGDTGYCYGIAATSLLLFERLGAENRNEPRDFLEEAEHTYELNSWEIMRHYVALNHIKQRVLAAPWAGKSPNDVLDQVTDLVKKGNDLPLIALWDRDWVELETFGHTLVAISVEDRGNGIYWVHVYDPNHPVQETIETDTYIEFDTNQNSWKYDNKNSLGVVSGNGPNVPLFPTIQILPISNHAMQAVFPWNRLPSLRTGSGLLETETVEISLRGEGSLQIVDPFGKRVGFTEGGFVNEIPGAAVDWSIEGFDFESDPTYRLPSFQSYEIILEGSDLGTPSVAGIAKFDRGSAAVIENIAVSGDTRDVVTVSPNSSIAYKPNQAQEVNVQLATKTQSAEYLVELHGTDLTGNSKIILAFDQSRQEVSISHAEASASEYSLQLTRVNAQGESRFTHDVVRIESGETQLVKLDTWTSQEVTVCTDVDSDGQTESCESLQNEFVLQGNSIFMPFIMR